MKWRDARDKSPCRQWARYDDGTYYAIFRMGNNQGSARWSVHRRLPGDRYDTGVGDRATLAEARQCAEDDLASIIATRLFH